MTVILVLSMIVFFLGLEWLRDKVSKGRITKPEMHFHPEVGWTMADGGEKKKG